MLLPIVSGSDGVPPATITGSPKLIVKSRFRPERYVPLGGTATLVTTGATPSMRMFFWAPIEAALPGAGRVRFASNAPALRIVAPLPDSAAAET